MPGKTTARPVMPVTILTGFLGAGKTTFLNHILNAEHGLRVAVLVNDFGSINVDGQLVVSVDESESTIELSNGCICCTIRGDLINALIGLIRREDPPEYILIEASGVSDPLEIALSFKNPALESLIQVDSVVTLIDAEQVLDLDRQDKVMAVLQVGAADIIMLNKVDLVDAAQLEKVRAWIRSIIADARILETTYGQVPLALVIGVGTFDPQRLEDHTWHDVHVHQPGTTHDGHDHHHHDHSMIYDTWSWTARDPLSLKEMRRVVEKLPVELFRAKGLLYLADDPEHMGLLQVVGRRASVSIGEPWGPRTPASQIVMIGQQGSIDRDSLAASFEGALAKNAPKSELHRLTDSVLSWLRKSREG